ncbi:MAG TPA: cysteine--tRNA ligase [Rhizomicrobium sp.]|nr:cysteine--tRNA ligase [Rhizomicrobium sp.]
MSLRLYNTLTRQKDELGKLPGFDPANVRMYVCGPTVYDFAHIGNARPVIVFDVLYRLLRHLYGPEHVTYVRNITDIDDKINARAAETAAAKGISVEQARVEITTQTAAQFKADVEALGCLAPTQTPRATEYVGQMIAMIERLVAEGHAYAAEGHVLFDVASKPDYGKLARRSLDEMMAGARVEVAPYKKNPMDFVLWKPSDDTTPGWPSPWGRGRPGWHIECSAMGEALLGETFDIHGGGIDLMFPHHENEIAQSECAHGGHALARVWMHNGFLQVEGEKMAKSLGNFITIRDLLDLWPGDALRLNMLRTNYNQPIDWTNDSLLQAMDELRVWSELVAFKFGENADLSTINGEVDSQVVVALSDNLNTHLALSRFGHVFQAAKANKAALGDFVRTGLFLGFRHLNKPGFFHHGFTANLVESGPQISRTEELGFVSYRALTANSLSSGDGFDLEAARKRHELEDKGFVLEINDAGVLFVGNKTSADLERDTKARIEEQIAARTAARKAKNFKESDRIRDELLAKGIVLKDGPSGTTWEVKR